MNTNDAAATLITYLLCRETVTRGLTRFVIHHCTYEGTEIVRRETRPIDSLGSILKVRQNRVHILCRRFYRMFSRSTALVVEPISLVTYAGQFFGARSYIVQGHTYRGCDTYDLSAPTNPCCRQTIDSSSRTQGVNKHKWNANGASCSRAVAVYVATFTTSMLCKEGHVSYACIRNPRLVEIQYLSLIHI